MTTHDITTRIPAQPTVAPSDSVAKCLTRAVELLTATRNYLHENPIAAEYTTFYDGTQCDGYCLADDCEILLEEIAAITGG